MQVLCTTSRQRMCIPGIAVESLVTSGIFPLRAKPPPRLRNHVASQRSKFNDRLAFILISRLVLMPIAARTYVHLFDRSGFIWSREFNFEGLQTQHAHILQF